jgi:hypothetical protein
VQYGALNSSFGGAVTPYSSCWRGGLKKWTAGGSKCFYGDIMENVAEQVLRNMTMAVDGTVRDETNRDLPQ